MKRCSRCVLPETFPGIQFDEHGVCQYCRRGLQPRQSSARKAQLRERFERLAQEVRDRPGYHCLAAWSGGKDSTYVLWLLKERYGLNVLAFTFNNGFVDPAAMKNMRVVAESLEVDHIIVKPRFDLLRQIFVASMEPGMYSTRALERASGICTSCMALAKGMGLRLALEKDIPLLAYGWSPGQIPLASALFRTNSRMLEAMVQTSMTPLEELLGDAVKPYFPEPHQMTAERAFPYNVSPLAFLDYDEESAVRQIRTLGWRSPRNTDPNSTNCLLNTFANLIHCEQMGFHPYAMELAGLVREGYMDRDEALARLEAQALPEVVAAVRSKLGLSPLGCWERKPSSTSALRAPIATDTEDEHRQQS